MAISSLRIADFRNLSAVEIEPCQRGLNIICGNNGSGKTSLLEAIHYLGLGLSFRSSAASNLIRHDAEQFSLFAQVVSDTERHVPVGVERHLNGRTRLRMAEQDVAGIAEVASLLPIRIINSHSHNLFESGPIFRRKFLNWGLFYQSEGFLLCWRQFERVLRQRNAVLRDKRPKKELDAWTDELLKYALEMDQLRRDYVGLLIPLVTEIAMELLSITNIQINYLSGWDTALDYASALMAQFPEEYRVGYTQIGPHRADLEVTVGGVPVKHILSRGQQKLLVCAMILAQGMLLTRQVKKGLVYLVDDLPSELDGDSRNKLISLLSRQPTQVFITAIESETICEFVRGKPEVAVRVFHVEHGVVIPRGAVIPSAARDLEKLQRASRDPSMCSG